MVSESRDLDEQESTKLGAKMGIDAERIRSSVARLTLNSITELENLTSELEKLLEFLKSETQRVQREIESVLDGIKILVEAITPWKTVDVADEQNARTSGRDRLKRWP
jgi:predicted transcriptional regulator